MQDYRLFIDGKWLAGAGQIPTISPATGQQCASTALASPSDVVAALSAAEKGLKTWKNTAPSERAGVLRRAAKIFRARSQDLIDPFCRQQGKMRHEAQGEYARVAETFEWTADQAENDFSRRYPRSGAARVTLPEAVGVVAAFVPWNYPALLCARKLAAPLAAGCSVVMKSAEETPAPVVAIFEALQEAGLPDGVANLLFGDPPSVAKQLMASPSVRKVTFTGSTAVGKGLATLAAGNLIPCTLELGGHAPVLVFPDVDIEAVVRQLVEFKFECAGQSCNAPARLFVHEEIEKLFLDALVETTSQLKVGAYDEPGSQMGPLQHARRHTAVASLVADAKAKGASAITGGHGLERPGYFYAPTILANVSSSARIMDEEPFGPVLPIFGFSDEADVISNANASRMGLAAYCFTGDSDRARRIAARMSVGYLGVNGLCGIPADAPTGGVRDSGYGIEGGIEGIEDFLHQKLVTTF